MDTYTYYVYTLQTEYELKQVLVLDEVAEEDGFDVTDHVAPALGDYEVNMDGKITIEAPAALNVPEVMMEIA